MTWRRFNLLLAIAVVSLVGIFLWNTPTAHAAAYCATGYPKLGLSGCQGFFTGATSGAGFGVPSNLMTGGLQVSCARATDCSPSLIGRINDALNIGTADEGSKNGITRDEMGAAMIVDVMMGQGPYSSRATGVDEAVSLYPDWKDLVNYYEDSTSSSYGVDWSASDCGGANNRNSAYFSDINDDAFHDNQDGCVPVIQFFWASGGTTKTFELQKSCGNLFGDLNFPSPNWKLSGETTLSSATAQPGQTVTFSHFLSNTGGDTASGYKYVVEDAPGGGSPTVIAGPTTGPGLTNAASPRLIINENYTVPAGAVPGTTHCQRIGFDPVNAAGTVRNGRGPYKCVTIVANNTCPIRGAAGAPLGCVDQVSCAAIVGWAFDPTPGPPANQSGRSIWINMYIDGNPNPLPYHTNLLRPDVNTRFAITGNHGFSVAPSALGIDPYAAHSIQIVARGSASNSAEDGNNTNLGTYNLPQCLALPDCSSQQAISSLPAFFEPGTNGTVTIGFPAAPTVTIDSITDSFGNVVSFGFATPATFGVPGGGGTLTLGVTSPSGPGAARAYTMTWHVPSNVATGSCTGGISIVDLPYFNVTGADVSAGGEFKTLDASCAGGGELASWYNNSTASPYGSSTRLAALALIKIVGFASAQGVNPGTGLTFANTALPASDFSTDLNSPSLGGDMNSGGGTTGHCLTEQTVPSVASGITVTNIPTGSADKTINGLVGSAPTRTSFTHTGDLTINGPIRAGQNVSIFVTGDVYIDDNITYDTGASWSLARVPSFVLVATGNIYIDNDVSRLDGLYIARNTTATGTAGQIFTCADSMRHPVATTTLYGDCNHQLLVNGSFVAEQINLLRTYGTLKDASNSAPSSCTNDGGPPAVPPLPTTSSCGAEVFQFSPEMYLSNPAVEPPSQGALQYDAIVSLPPIL